MQQILDWIRQTPGLYWELLGDAVGVVSLFAFFYIVIVIGSAVAS